MNFLAHLYLSGSNDHLKVGNFIADWVKGKNYTHFPEMVQTGISLHRHIDSFTDAHPLVKQSISKLRPDYGKYAGIIIDIFYDHFLAANWDKYSKQSLPSFARNSYIVMLANFRILPAEVKAFIFKLILSNRLETYRTIIGIENVLNLMSNHTSLPNQTKKAINILATEYDSFYAEFDAFFIELKANVQSKFAVNFS
jgi:acyl carrier protein phosphodiesterase